MLPEIAERYVDALNEAHYLVDHGWGQQAFAYDAQGNSTSPLSNNACRFCMTGALRRAAEHRNLDPERLQCLIALVVWAREKAAKYYPGDCQRADDRYVAVSRLWGWNDNPDRKKTQVLSVLKKAVNLIKRAYA